MGGEARLCCAVCGCAAAAEVAPIARRRLLSSQSSVCRAGRVWPGHSCPARPLELRRVRAEAVGTDHALYRRAACMCAVAHVAGRGEVRLASYAPWVRVTWAAYAFVDWPRRPCARPYVLLLLMPASSVGAAGRPSRACARLGAAARASRPSAALHAVTGGGAVSGRRLRRRPSPPSSLSSMASMALGVRRRAARRISFVPAHPPLTGSVLGLLWSRCRMHA